MPTVPISGEPLWGDPNVFVDPGASSVGGGTGGGTGGSGGSGGTGAGSHLYWRLHITGVLTNGVVGTDTPVVAEWKLYDSSGTQIPTTTGTASASSTFPGQPAANAFDGNASTFWNANNDATSASPEWLAYQFLSAVAVDHFSITTRNDSLYHQGPAYFSLQSSDDGTTWTDAFTYEAAAFEAMSAGATITFYTTGIVYRLNVTSTQAGTGHVSIANVVFKDGSGNTISTATGTPLASGSYSGGGDPANAFAGTCASMWRSALDLATVTPQWLGFQFPTGVTVGSFSFESPSTGPGSVGETPINFSLQSSTDGANFTTIQSFTAAAWTTGCQLQTFNAPGGGGGSASIVLNPNQGLDGSNYVVAVTGIGTHFAQGVTQVTMSGDGVTITQVTVTDATDLSFNLAIASTASVGARTVTTVTNAEAPTATFTILPAAPTPPSTQPGFVRGDIGWSQLRLGRDGRWGLGAYGCSTDGSFLPGNIPTVNADGTLIGSGVAVGSVLTPSTLPGSDTVDGAPVGGTTGGDTVNGSPVGGSGNPTVNGQPVGNAGGSAGSSATYTITGSVTPALASVSMTASGLSTTQTATNANGTFSLTVSAIGTYTLTPSLAGYTFAPTSKSVTVSGATTTTTPFTATAISSGSPGATDVADQIANDMIGANEAHPHGVPTSYDFYSGPVIGVGINVGTNQAAEFWFVAYQNASTASTSSNTSIEVKGAQFWWLRASTGQWVKGLAPDVAGLSGGYYNEDFSGSQLSNITFNSQSDGGVALGMIANEVAHGFDPYPRIPIDPNDFGGAVSTIFARLVLTNPLGADDRANAHYIVSSGADPYPTTTSAGANNITAIMNGKMKIVTNSYRSFSATTLTKAQLETNPPPVDFTGISA